MIDDYFNYGKVTENDVEYYGAVPGTMKITGIKDTNNGVVDIPETINGLPVTCYDGIYHHHPLKKLIIPKTLVAWCSMGIFAEIECELVIHNDHPKWSTDGISILSKDGTKLIKMCQPNRESYSIPEGVTTICSHAFKFNKNTELYIPESVTTVKDGAFEYCYSLEFIHGGENIVHCGRKSFSDTAWYNNSPVLILGTTLLRFDTEEENVVVPEGVEIIASEAFSSAGGKDVILETVKLPSTVREIGEYAFSGKKNLKTINFPDGLQTIKKGAFFYCESLSEIVLPDSITEIGVRAFEQCSSVKKVVIPNAVSGAKTENFLYGEEVASGHISAKSFIGCKSLEHIEIPEGIVSIGDSAFAFCLKLKSVRIPDSVQAIGDKAFQCCFELEELFLPASCIELGRNFLPHTEPGWSAAKFSRIDVDPENEKFSVLDGILCSKNGDTLIACPSQYNVVDYTIPEGVKEILPGAFEGCAKIRRVVFAGTVEKIGARAFAKMPALEEIVLPPDCPALGDGLFMECEKLKCITWPRNLREIGAKCFANTGIENLAIPETVETVGAYAFSDIKAKKVRLPKTIKNISLSVFAGVPEIEVYDTIDSDAMPAAEHLSDANGDANGKVGFIGIYLRDNHLPAACDSVWYEHTIIVRSAEDDSEKFRVRMPNGQRRKVYCTFASSWGKNAEFNFVAVDNIFKDLTADAKLDYVFNRVRYQEGISEEMLGTLKRYVAKNAKDIAARIFKADAVDDLAMFESFGIIKKNTLDERLDAASKVGATECKAWILSWQNSNLSTKEKAAKTTLTLKIAAPTVAEIKRIWPHKKGADGGLTITGYNGKDVDIRVPEIIGKKPVTAIADCCFSNNKDQDQQAFLRTQLRSVEIPDSVVNIGRMAFGYCKALESVKLPKMLQSISPGMFYGCDKLSVDMPDGIIVIYNDAFEGCTMKSITVPSSVKAIGKTAFGQSWGWGTVGMPKLESIEVDPASKHFKSIDGVLFSFDGTTLVKYPPAKTSTEYEVPDGVTEISKNAFSRANALKSVAIPESVDIIDDDAFCECSNLETVLLPTKASGLGHAFRRCTALKKIIVPEGIDEIRRECFSDCSSLHEVVLPKGLKKIDHYAFFGCAHLEAIRIPSSVRGIGEGAFKGCKSLVDITISKSVTGMGYFVFDGCDELTVHAPAGSVAYLYAKDHKIKVVDVGENS